MSGSSIPKHFQGRTHTRKYRRVQALEEEAEEASVIERRKYSASLAASLGQLGLPRWRNEIKACLYDYIQTGGDESVLIRTVKRFLLLERLSLLELALWKASICDGVLFSSMQEMREYEVLDSAFDPNAYATEKRVTSGCEVIIPLVLSFLKQE